MWGCPREKILSRSANRPLDENDYHLTFSTFSSARQKAKLARKNCEILPKNNLPKTIDGRARPMRLLPHRMSLPTEGKPRSTRRRHREGRKKSSWKSLSKTATRGKQKFQFVNTFFGGFMEPDIFLFVGVFITSALSFIGGAIMAHYMDLH